MRVLVLEDEQKINDMIRLYAEQDGHSVRSAFSAEAALTLVSKEDFDLIVCDLMLPGLPGEDFVEEIRRRSDVHIIVLTAKTETDSKLRLLGEGADDYITKPFTIDELLLKLRNIEKRSLEEKPVEFTFRGQRLTFDDSQRVVRFNDQRIPLKDKEYRILRYLAKHPGRVLSRTQIIEACAADSEAFDRIVDTYVKAIRKKLNAPRMIETVYGEGYRFQGEPHHG